MFKQYQDGKRGITNKRLLDLINNYAWYKYDGSEGTAKQINDDREKNSKNILQKLDGNTNPLKKKITFSDNVLQAGVLLQQSDDLDSKYAYKDLKELLVDLKYYKREDLKDPIRKVLTWPLYNGTMGETWPSGEKNKDINKYGVKILSEEAIKAEFGATESTHEKIEVERIELQIQQIRRDIDRTKKDSSLNEEDRKKKIDELEKELETQKKKLLETQLRLLEESTIRIAAKGTDEEIAEALKNLKQELSKETNETKKASLEKRIKILEDEQKRRKNKKDNKDKKDGDTSSTVDPNTNTSSNGGSGSSGVTGGSNDIDPSNTKTSASGKSKFMQVRQAIVAAGQKTGIESGLLAAITGNESGFNPNATGGPRNNSYRNNANSSKRLGRSDINGGKNMV